MWVSRCVQVTPGVPSASPVGVGLKKHGLVNTAYENLGVSIVRRLLLKFKMSSLLVGGREVDVKTNHSQNRVSGTQTLQNKPILLAWGM